jgi:superoxide dismutase
LLEKSKKQFYDAARGIRGSSWAWLVLDSIIKSSYVSTPCDRMVAEKRSDALKKWGAIFNDIAYSC